MSPSTKVAVAFIAMFVLGVVSGLTHESFYMGTGFGLVLGAIVFGGATKN